MNPAHLFRTAFALLMLFTVSAGSAADRPNTYLPSKDGKFIHVVFMYYDDDKGHIPEESYNPLYKRNVGNI